MAYTYEATFSMERWHGVPNNWVECEGIRLESNIAIAIISEICRALKAAGKPDGAIVFFEDGYTDPVYRFPSIYEIILRTDAPSSAKSKPAKPSTAATREPTATNLPSISNTIYLALIQIDTDPVNWRGLHGRARSILLDRGLVDVDDDVPRVTEFGRLAMEAHQDSQNTYPDLATASKAELLNAAATIGLKITNAALGRTLKFIEATIVDRSMAEVEALAWKVQVPVRLGRCKSEAMKKRRILAAIVNAGKLAQAI